MFLHEWCGNGSSNQPAGRECDWGYRELLADIAANLRLGLSMPAAAQAASDYVERALRLGYQPGRSDIVMLDHFGAAPPMRR